MRFKTNIRFMEETHRNNLSPAIELVVRDLRFCKDIDGAQIYAYNVFDVKLYIPPAYVEDC